MLLLVHAPAAHAAGSDLRLELEFLTDSLSDGRATGTAGAQRTAFYIFRQMRNAGLRTSFQSFSAGGKAAHNVVGVTPGWFHNYIVIGAYYDGLGNLDGVLYPGADANASGVAALLSLARTLPSVCDGGTGVIFVAFDAHNCGMLGPEAFLKRFSGQYSMSMMVNLDTIGSDLEPLRADKPEYIIALGGDNYSFDLRNANRGLWLDISYSYYGSANFTDLFYRKLGEQRSFIQAGIPSVMFTSGITANTNKNSDTVENLNLPLLEKRIALIAKWLTERL